MACASSVLSTHSSQASSRSSTKTRRSRRSQFCVRGAQFVFRFEVRTELVRTLSPPLRRRSSIEPGARTRNVELGTSNRTPNSNTNAEQRTRKRERLDLSDAVAPRQKPRATRLESTPLTISTDGALASVQLHER